MKDLTKKELLEIQAQKEYLLDGQTSIRLQLNALFKDKTHRSFDILAESDGVPYTYGHLISTLLIADAQIEQLKRVIDPLKLDES